MRQHTKNTRRRRVALVGFIRDVLEWNETISHYYHALTLPLTLHRRAPEDRHAWTVDQEYVRQRECS